MAGRPSNVFSNQDASNDNFKQLFSMGGRRGRAIQFVRHRTIIGRSTTTSYQYQPLQVHPQQIKHNMIPSVKANRTDSINRKKEREKPVNLKSPASNAQLKQKYSCMTWEDCRDAAPPLSTDPSSKRLLRVSQLEKCSTVNHSSQKQNTMIRTPPRTPDISQELDSPNVSEIDQVSQVSKEKPLTTLPTGTIAISSTIVDDASVSNTIQDWDPSTSSQTATQDATLLVVEPVQDVVVVRWPPQKEKLSAILTSNHNQHTDPNYAMDQSKKNNAFRKSNKNNNSPLQDAAIQVVEPVQEVVVVRWPPQEEILSTILTSNHNQLTDPDHTLNQNKKNKALCKPNVNNHFPIQDAIGCLLWDVIQRYNCGTRAADDPSILSALEAKAKDAKIENVDIIPPEIATMQDKNDDVKHEVAAIVKNLFCAAAIRRQSPTSVMNKECFQILSRTDSCLLQSFHQTITANNQLGTKQANIQEGYEAKMNSNRCCSASSSKLEKESIAAIVDETEVHVVPAFKKEVVEEQVSPHRQCLDLSGSSRLTDLEVSDVKKQVFEQQESSSYRCMDLSSSAMLPNFNVSGVAKQVVEQQSSPYHCMNLSSSFMLPASDVSVVEQQSSPYLCMDLSSSFMIPDLDGMRYGSSVPMTSTKSTKSTDELIQKSLSRKGASRATNLESTTCSSLSEPISPIEQDDGDDVSTSSDDLTDYNCQSQSNDSCEPGLEVVAIMSTPENDDKSLTESRFRTRVIPRRASRSRSSLTVQPTKCACKIVMTSSCKKGINGDVCSRSIPHYNQHISCLDGDDVPSVFSDDESTLYYEGPSMDTDEGPSMDDSDLNDIGDELTVVYEEWADSVSEEADGVVEALDESTWFAKAMLKQFAPSQYVTTRLDDIVDEVFDKLDEFDTSIFFPAWQQAASDVNASVDSDSASERELEYRSVDLLRSGTSTSF